MNKTPYWKKPFLFFLSLTLVFSLCLPVAAEEVTEEADLLEEVDLIDEEEVIEEEELLITPSLPMDYKTGGMPPKKDGWTLDGKIPVSYQDSTISVTFETDSITHKLSAGRYRGRTVTDEIWTVRIQIGHPSQLRTAVSSDSYKRPAHMDSIKLATGKNAVVAMNGDYFKSENRDAGYVVRQGELIRDATHNARGLVFDTLLIDSEGDFHVVYAAVTETIDEYIAENLTPFGRTVMDSFNIGPVLVLNGEVQDVARSEVTKHGGREGMYQWSTPIQRISIVQTGHLEYAIVAANAVGNRKSGFTLTEFAKIVADQCPGALLAYNLDGGGSAQVAAHGRKLFTNSYMRHITDIIYFASAEE